jgi:agmatinase
MSDFNPNDIALDNGNLYGLPKNIVETDLVVVSVPWDVTVSYAEGTSHAPQLIQEESLQVDLYDFDYANFWEKGIYFVPPNDEILQLSKKHRAMAKEAIRLQAIGENPESNTTLKQDIDKVNIACEQMIQYVYDNTKKLIQEKKKVVLLGGDHSTPYGYFKALSDSGVSFGILQIDAHMDLRESYEYFKYSHASIMYNTLKLEGIHSLCQVGIRDFCEEESEFAINTEKQVNVFYDRAIKKQLIEGKSWVQICDEIVASLPQKIYISFDIDGLDPALCPNTGTPVPGGFDIDSIFYLLDKVKASGKEIVGIDLNEVGNSAWDANVGARVLYRLCGLWMS